MANSLDFIDWLQGTLLFQGLCRSQLDSVTKIAQIQTFNREEIIFKEGSEAVGFFVVKYGRVKIYKISAGGKEQILNIFETKDNFAEVAALDGKAFPASAASLETSELIFFPRLPFLDLLHQYPDISINMLISLSKHLRHLTGVVEDLSFRDVPQRLATYLINLSEKFRSNIVILDLPKSQLAAQLGTIPATLSRAFYRLSNEGLIAVTGSQIEILDRDRLQDLGKSLGQGDL